MECINNQQSNLLGTKFGNTLMIDVIIIYLAINTFQDSYCEML